MKQLKYILSFFLLLILQLSFANSFASVYLNKDKVVSRIEFSETTNSNPEFPKADFKENYIFEPFFYDNVTCPSISCCGAYTELVNSWKILSNGSTSLKSIDNINAVHAFRVANPGIADDPIQAAFDGLKTSRKQAFVNALGSCADNKNLIGSLNKSKLASVDEIKDALNRMRDYRSGVPAGGNYGYLEGNIPGVAVDNKMWRSVSLTDARNEIHIFDAIDATGSSGTWLRITDSEYRMLNKLASDLKAVKGGKKYPDVTGTLKIVSENPYCTSCQGVIQQFSDMFPNIEIKLIDGIR
jgi:hypothetical protein